jgi:hypothetical protein
MRIRTKKEMAAVKQKLSEGKNCHFVWDRNYQKEIFHPLVAAEINYF